MYHGQNSVLAAMSTQLAIINEIKQKQREDDFFKKVHDEFETKPRSGFTIEDQVLKFQGRLCVPNDAELKKRNLKDAHK